MSWQPVLPMGTVLEGGRGEESDAAGLKSSGEGTVGRCAESFT